MPAKHTPRGDDSFRTSLLRSGAGAVGLVALVSLVFALLGGLGTSTDGPLVADDPGEPAEEPGGVGAGAEEPEDEPEEEPEDEPEEGPEPADEPPGGDEPEDESAEAPEPAEEPSEADDGDDDGDGAGEPEPDEPEREFAPDGVTVQVLDGHQADGGSAAAALAATLRDLGYRVVAENPALRYEATTVLWTPGFEAQARQVAADIGAAEVRAQPGNLSEQVQVHVVVGADRAS